MKGGAQEGKQDPGADFEEKTLILEVPRNENKILGQTLKKNINPRGAQQEKKDHGADMAGKHEFWMCPGWKIRSWDRL